MVEQWHHLISQPNMEGLENILADEVVFYSPVVFSPQRGKDLAVMYLAGAMKVLLNAHFKYVKEVTQDRMAVLEFVSRIDDVEINGVDIITWNSEGKITEFKVMVRPKMAMLKLQEEMWKLLQEWKGIS